MAQGPGALYVRPSTAASRAYRFVWDQNALRSILRIALMLLSLRTIVTIIVRVRVGFPPRNVKSHKNVLDRICRRDDYYHNRNVRTASIRMYVRATVRVDIRNGFRL